jgi:glutathione S-transferase
MRLYHSPVSPYVRKVMVLLIETGQTADVTLVPATGNPLDPGSMPVAQNPLGKIPCLERPDGPAIFDSRVICRFLDDRAGGRLYPAAPGLWETLTLEALADGVLDAALLMRYETHVRPETARSPDWIEGQWAKIARALDAVEDRWIAQLNGPFDMGQVALACALGYLGFRHDERDWRAGRPLLSQWDERIVLRESLAATVPTG